MKKEVYLLGLNACIFLVLLLVPRDLNGRIHPLSLEASRGVMLTVACAGLLVSIGTFVCYRNRWVLPTLCFTGSVMCIVQFLLR